MQTAEDAEEEEEEEEDESTSEVSKCTSTTTSTQQAKDADSSSRSKEKPVSGTSSSETLPRKENRKSVCDKSEENPLPALPPVLTATPHGVKRAEPEKGRDTGGKGPALMADTEMPQAPGSAGEKSAAKADSSEPQSQVRAQ